MKSFEFCDNLDLEIFEKDVLLPGGSTVCCHAETSSSLGISLSVLTALLVLSNFCDLLCGHPNSRITALARPSVRLFVCPIWVTSSKIKKV